MKIAKERKNGHSRASEKRARRLKIEEIDCRGRDEWAAGSIYLGINRAAKRLSRELVCVFFAGTKALTNDCNELLAQDGTFCRSRKVL
jgi:hypothetical protein